MQATTQEGNNLDMLAVGRSLKRQQCDERKPTCSRCSEKDIQCNYIVLSTIHRQAQRENTHAIVPLLWPGACTPPVLSSSTFGRHTPYDLVLLDHFVRNLGHSVAGAEYSEIVTTKAIDIAHETPYLMHAMLALAAGHLQLVVNDGRAYRIPEALNTQLASQGLRTAVMHMRAAKDMDSVLTTSMILNCLAFCYADRHDVEQDSDQSTFNWNWLRILTGLKDLLIETRPFHAESIWMPMFIATKTFAITEPQLNDLDVRLAAYCNITAESTMADNPYVDFYTQLAPLVVRTPGMYYLRLYSNAIGGIDGQFVDLLEKQDSKAMLLFAHWLALMCSCASWWLIQRITRKCWALCQILDRRLRGDERVMLERPAEACGYPLESDHFTRGGAGCNLKERG